MNRRFVASLGLVGLVGLVGCPKPPVEPPVEHWCPEGFEAGYGDMCFALPPSHGPRTGIVVYLHGHMEGRGDPSEWVAAHGAVARGYAVVLPRGRRALCALQAGRENEFCWPLDPDEAKAVVADWDRTLWQVNELLEGDAHPRFVLASGEGAHFAARLALSGGFKAAAFALVGGGEAPAEPLAATERPPVLLFAAADNEKVNKLDKFLTNVGWRHERCTRAAGASLSTGELEVVLRFFQPNGGRTAFTCDGGPAPAPTPTPTPERAGAKR